MRDRFRLPLFAGLTMIVLRTSTVGAQEVKGVVKKVDVKDRIITLDQPSLHKDIKIHVVPDATFDTGPGASKKGLEDIKKGDRLTVTNAVFGGQVTLVPPEPE